MCDETERDSNESMEPFRMESIEGSLQKFFRKFKEELKETLKNISEAIFGRFSKRRSLSTFDFLRKNRCKNVWNPWMVF